MEAKQETRKPWQQPSAEQLNLSRTLGSVYPNSDDGQTANNAICNPSECS